MVSEMAHNFLKTCPADCDTFQDREFLKFENTWDLSNYQFEKCLKGHIKKCPLTFTTWSEVRVITAQMTGPCAHYAQGLLNLRDRLWDHVLRTQYFYDLIDHLKEFNILQRLIFAIATTIAENLLGNFKQMGNIWGTLFRDLFFWNFE
jgi:hypothetical protein